MKRSLFLGSVALAGSLATFGACDDPDTVPPPATPISVLKPILVSDGGLVATNLVRVCLATGEGTITASIPSDSGTIESATASVVPPSAECGASFGEAAFYWHGTKREVPWTFTLGGGGPNKTELLDMVIVQPCVGVAAKSKWASQKDSGASDASVDAADAADSGDAGSLADASAATDAGAASDAGAAGPRRVDVEVTLRFLRDCGDASPALSPVSLSSVSVTMSAGATPDTLMFTTDINGFGIFHFDAPAKADAADAYLNVGGIVTVPVHLSSD